MSSSSVYPGDIVRVLSLDPDFISAFPADERDLMRSMIGQLFQVIEVDEAGLPLIERTWHDEQGIRQAHVIALDANEFEKI